MVDVHVVDRRPVNSAKSAFIEAPAIRAIHAARSSGVPLLINLGGSPLSAALSAAVHSYPSVIIQTNVDDAEAANAADLASILAATGAAGVVITAGAVGAVALSRNDHISSPVFRVPVRHTHCAGAAFSGGLIYGLLHD